MSPYKVPEQNAVRSTVMMILTGTLLVIHQSSASSLQKIVPVAWTSRISLNTSKRRRAAGGGEIKNDIKGRIPVGVMDSTITVGSTEVPVEVLIKRDIIENRIIKLTDVAVEKDMVGSQGDTAAAKNNIVIRSSFISSLSGLSDSLLR